MVLASILSASKRLTRLTKDDETRDVEMADALRSILLELQAGRREDAFRRGRALSPYALFPAFEESTDRKAEQRVVKLIRRRMVRVLQRAGLPGHHTPHSLRHSFASILISKGPASGNNAEEGCLQALEGTGTFSPRPAPCPRFPWRPQPRPASH